MQQSEIRVGDRIVHKHMPGFAMEVLEVERCIGSGEPVTPDKDSHNSFKIIDPNGHEDWLCELEVFKLEKPSIETLIDFHRV